MEEISGVTVPLKKRALSLYVRSTINLIL